MGSHWPPENWCYRAPESPLELFQAPPLQTVGRSKPSDTAHATPFQTLAAKGLALFADEDPVYAAHTQAVSPRAQESPARGMGDLRIGPPQ